MSFFLSGITGNGSLVSRLAEEILTGTLPHAYIIEGQPGSGRRTVALAAAAALACTEKTADNIPCRACAACRRVFEGLTPDVIRVKHEKDKQSIGVDTSRFIQQDIITVPNDFDFKLYIIEDADTMTPQAQNALLLTLEEPPAYAYFILICESASSLLETVRSRAPVLRTEPVPPLIMKEFLLSNDKRAPVLAASATGELDEIIIAADGSIGRALNLLDSKAKQQALELRAFARDFIRLFFPGTPASDKLAFLPRFSQKRETAAEQLYCAVTALRDLILLKKTEYAPLCFWTDRDKAITISDRFTLVLLFSLIDRVQNAVLMLEGNANLRLTVTNLIIASDLRSPPREN